MVDTLDLSLDELLTTTRAVRRRLDFDRPVDLDVIEDCLRIALQAPSGSNRQGWHWVVITDIEQRARIAEAYRSAFAEYRAAASHSGGLFATDSGKSGAGTRGRVSRSVEYLAEHLHRVPVLVIACVQSSGSAVLADADQVTMWGSLLPAVWSYMLAARARGLGTAWTDLHLQREQDVAKILDLPEGVAKVHSSRPRTASVQTSASVEGAPRGGAAPRPLVRAIWDRRVGGDQWKGIEKVTANFPWRCAPNPVSPERI